MEDEEFLEIESPLEHAVEAEDDEIDEMMLQQGGAGGEERGSPGVTRTEATTSNPRANIATDKPIHYPAKPKDRATLLHYAKSLPYTCETLEEFDARLDDVCQHLIACIEGNEFDISFNMWNHYLNCLLTLKYPIELPTLARLARVYYHLAIRPGLHPMTSEMAANTCMVLLGGRKKIGIAHLILPWRPLYDVLKRELLAKERKTGQSNVSDSLLDLASYAQRFFDPEETDAMLQEMLPGMDGSNINSIIATLALLVHFLPTSHPQRWLPTLFRLWESFSSSLFDDQMLELCARLTEQHVEDPRVSSQKSLEETGMFADVRPTPSQSSKAKTITSEQGLWSDVGIFTEHQFNLIMTKCLRSAGLPVGSSKAANAALMSQSSNVHTGADSTASAGVLSMRKPADISHSFATIIIYSMMHDSRSPASATPSGATTPVKSNGHATSSSDEPAAKPTDEKIGTHLAGSKALSALSRFIQATESYFHPSNWGTWAFLLSNLVKNLTWEFAKRWKEEEKPECRTPKAFRLTPEIKREFVTTLRTVCLLSLFSKDPATIGASQSSLKRLAFLEPELVLPSVLERAYSSLEALETTHRTMSIITALSTLGIPLVSRHIYREGGKHLVPLLHLCLPGLDPNDPTKSIATCIFIVVTTTMIKVDDLTRPEIAASDAGEADEEDEALRLSTAGFEDWTVSFFRRVLSLFEALPEEGKNGRTGGRIEEQVMSTLLAACDAVCCSMSDHLFDINFKIVADYCLANVSAQGVRVAGSLISCFARHNPAKVMKRLLRPCAQVIRSELEQGASSIRTTSTSQPLSSDVTLHWHASVLIGSLTFAGEAILEYREDLLDLMAFFCDRAKSERGYSFASMLVQRVILLLVSTYPNDHRFLNPDEWNGPDMQGNSHRHWGKMYTVKEVKIQWHVPSEAEIGLAIEILDRIVQPLLDTVERLQDDQLPRDKAWSNDFCRHLTVIRMAYSSLNSTILEPEQGGGAQKDVYPYVDGYRELIQPPSRFQSGFLLEDPTDPHYQRIKAFKDQLGKTLHLAATKVQDSEAEDQIDCVKLLIRSIRTFMVSYAFNSDDYKAFERSMSFYSSMALVYPRQKIYPRVYWVRRAAHHHCSRGRLNSFYRRRTAVDDELIIDVNKLTMSNYVAIRKTAQHAYDDIVTHYDGTRTLTLEPLLDAVRESKNEDAVKGALYVLGSKHLSALPLRNPYWTEDYLMTLLDAQHHNKPSIQKALRGIINHFYTRFAEPCTRADRITSSGLDEALQLLDKATAQTTSLDPLLRSAPTRQRAIVNQERDRVWAVLVERLLEYAQRPTTHWNYTIFAARLLRTLIRKDQPLRADMAAYFTHQLASENPMIRRICQSAVAKMLYFAKLQTLCKTDEELVVGHSKVDNHPLKRVEAMPQVTEAWLKERMAAFRYDDGVGSDCKLFDKDAPGWLVWSDRQTYYLPPPEDDVVFDWASKPALEAIEQGLTHDHWSQMLKHFAQEKDRESLSAETLVMVKSIFQVFGVSQLEVIKEELTRFVAERDRHKHRAAAEVIAGMYRGAKHWPQRQSRELWAWLEAILPQILSELTPDSQAAWQEGVEYMVQQRDPRRAKPLIRLVIDAARESLTSNESPWDQVKANNLARGVALSLNVKFTPWIDDMLALYNDHLDTEFNEVRAILASSMADMDLSRVAPSFPTVDHLLATLNAQEQAQEHGSLFAPPEAVAKYTARFAQLNAILNDLKQHRVRKSEGISKYDLVALTALGWIAETLLDHRRNAMAPCVVEFIPTIIACCQLQDHAELHLRARSVLVSAVSTLAYFDGQRVGQLVRKVLEVIAHSQDSWRTRLDALPVLQILYWQNIFYLDADLLRDITGTLLGLLSDPHLEVRSLASTTLSGIVRCSQRELIQELRQRFTAQVVRYDRLPKRGSAGFAEALTDLHAGILGCIALISAFPYSIPTWMPALIIDTVARHQDAPDPVGTACRRMAADFKRTHQDTWEEDSKHLTPDQLNEIHDWGSESSYYA